MHRGSDVESLNLKFGSDIQSTTDQRSSDIKSINSLRNDAQNTHATTRSANVTSIANKIGLEDVFAKTYDLSTYYNAGTDVGASTFDADWSTTEFSPSTNPVVCGMLRSTNASDPIIAVMLKGAQDFTTGAKFAFSDELASANYSLEILASKNDG